MFFVKKNWFKLLILVFVAVFLYIIYQALIVTPQVISRQEVEKEQIRVNGEERMQVEKEVKLSQCLKEASAFLGLKTRESVFQRIVYLHIVKNFYLQTTLLQSSALMVMDN